MVDGNTVDRLDGVARLLRGQSSKPFGGLQVRVSYCSIAFCDVDLSTQLVVCGDFFQVWSHL